VYTSIFVVSVVASVLTLRSANPACGRVCYGLNQRDVDIFLRRVIQADAIDPTAEANPAILTAFHSMRKLK